MSHRKCQRWGGEVRLATWLGDKASSSVSLFFSSSLSLLHSQTCSEFLLPLFFKLLYACFLTATNILPRGQDLPLNMHARAHACTHAHVPTPPRSCTLFPPPISLIRTRTHNPIASVRLFKRDNPSEQDERESEH